MSISRPASPVTGKHTPARLIRAELVHVAEGLHRTQVLVARRAWDQAEGDPPPGDFVLHGNERDAAAVNTCLSAFTHTLGVRNATEDLGERFPNHAPEMGPEEWVFLQDRVFTIVDTGFDHLSPYGHEHLDPILEEIRSTLLRLSSGGINTVSAGQRLAEDYPGLYKDWEYVRLARTEMAHAWEVGREHVLTNVFGADRGPYSKVAEEFELRFGGIPVHPNCNCGSDVVEGPDGNLYMIIRPNASACLLCNEVADEIVAAVEGVERLPYVPDDEQLAAGAVFLNPDGVPDPMPVPPAAGTTAKPPPAARPSVTGERVASVTDKATLTQSPRQSVSYGTHYKETKEGRAAHREEYWNRAIPADPIEARKAARRTHSMFRLMEDDALDRYIEGGREVLVKRPGHRATQSGPRMSDFYDTDETVGSVWDRYVAKRKTGATGFKGKRADKLFESLANSSRYGPPGRIEAGDRLLESADDAWRSFLGRKQKGFDKEVRDTKRSVGAAAWADWQKKTLVETEKVAGYGRTAHGAGTKAARKAWGARRAEWLAIDEELRVNRRNLDSETRQTLRGMKQEIQDEAADAYIDAASIRSHKDAQKRAAATLKAWGVPVEYRDSAKKALYRAYRLSSDDVADMLHASVADYNPSGRERASATAANFLDDGSLRYKAKINVSRWTSDATHLHELVHVLEGSLESSGDWRGKGRGPVSPGITFRDAHATGDPMREVPLGGGYRGDEKYVEGPWFNNYTGKTYGLKQGTEGLAMAATHLADIGKFLALNKEFDAFTNDTHIPYLLGVLQGAVDRQKAGD